MGGLKTLVKILDIRYTTLGLGLCVVNILLNLPSTTFFA